MYVLFVVLVAAALSAVLWLDNSFLHGAGQFWWLLLVAAYLLTALDISLRDLRYRDRVLLAGAGLSIAAVASLCGPLLTLYLSAAVLTAISLAAWHREPGRGRKFNRTAILALGCLAMALILLPLAINRVEVRLPNLSAGTKLTLLANADATGSLDAEFVNRKDDHSELTTWLGAQIVPGTSETAPRLRVDIERDHIVVRILSVRYQSHLAFLDITAAELIGKDLAQLIALNPDTVATLAMDGERLLISDLEVGQPLDLTLPRIDQYRFSAGNRLLSALLRMLLLAAICYGLSVWVPHRAPSNMPNNKVPGT